MTTPIIQAFVRCLSFVDSDYPSQIVSWKECIETLKNKGDKVLTDLMILPSKLVQKRINLFDLKKVGTDCYTKGLPHISSLTDYQREIRELVKIQIHLFTFVEEKIKAEGLSDPLEATEEVEIPPEPEEQKSEVPSVTQEPVNV
jgi:hypothetical protein